MTTKMNETLNRIANQLGWPSLETSNVDSKDFREVAVWDVERALRAAYEAGREAGRRHAEEEQSAADSYRLRLGCRNK